MIVQEVCGRCAGGVRQACLYHIILYSYSLTVYTTLWLRGRCAGGVRQMHGRCAGGARQLRGRRAPGVTILYYTMLDYTILSCDISIIAYPILSYAILCYAMLCYTMLPYPISSNPNVWSLNPTFLKHPAASCLTRPSVCFRASQNMFAS